MTLAKTLRWLALATSLTAAAAGCKDKGGATTPPNDSTSSAAGTPAPRATGPARKSSERKGWRWEGKRDNCYFLVGKECFETRESACTAGGCTAETCKLSSGIPAHVSCAKK